MESNGLLNNDTTKSEFSNKNYTKTILVIEDDLSIQLLMRILLERKGYNVITKENWKKWFEEYKKQANIIDLLILDHWLPDINSINVLKEIRKTNSEIYIIMTSWKWSIKDFSWATDFLSKPFCINEFYDKINAIIS